MTKLKLAAALAVAAIVITACGSANPGAAATVGETRISEQQLTTEVQTVLTAQGHPIDQANEELTRKVLDRLVKHALVDQVAQKAGVVITQGQIDSQILSYATQAGGRQELEGLAIGQGIAPSQIASVAKLDLQVAALAQAVSPGADPQTAGQQLISALGQYSAMVGTSISPRYGTWDPQSLTVGGLPTDLSVPLAG